MSGLHTIFEPVINMQYLSSTVDLTESGSENVSTLSAVYVYTYYKLPKRSFQLILSCKSQKHVLTVRCRLLLHFQDGKFEKSKSQQCKVCSKVLSSTSSYYVHMKIHTGNKPFHCNECGASFSRKPYLEVNLPILVSFTFSK